MQPERAQRCGVLPVAIAFRGMDVSGANRLRALEPENSKLRKPLAEAHLDVEALKVAFGVKREPHRPSGQR